MENIYDTFYKIGKRLEQEKEKLKQYHEIEYKEPSVQDLRKLLFEK